MLIFSYSRIPQQFTSSVRLTDWGLSMPVCYPVFLLISLYDNAIREFLDYRLVREKIWRPRNNPATATSRRIQESEPPACSSWMHFCLLCSFSRISVSHSNLRLACDLQTQASRCLSVIPCFHLSRWMTTLYANFWITDSSGRKYADRAMR